MDEQEELKKPAKRQKCQKQPGDSGASSRMHACSPELTHAAVHSWPLAQAGDNSTAHGCLSRT